MSVQTRKRRKADIYALTPKLRESLIGNPNAWGLKPDDESRVRRCLSALPARRMDVLYSVARLNGGEPVTRMQLSGEYQSESDYDADLPVKPLMPYLVKHLEALVEAGFVEKRASGKGAELLYFVPAGIIHVLHVLSHEARQRREEAAAARKPAAPPRPAAPAPAVASVPAPASAAVVPSRAGAAAVDEMRRAAAAKPGAERYKPIDAPIYTTGYDEALKLPKAARLWFGMKVLQVVGLGALALALVVALVVMVVLIQASP